MPNPFTPPQPPTTEKLPTLNFVGIPNNWDTLALLPSAKTDTAYPSAVFAMVCKFGDMKKMKLSFSAFPEVSLSKERE